MFLRMDVRVGGWVSRQSKRMGVMGGQCLLDIAVENILAIYSSRQMVPVGYLHQQKLYQLVRV